MSLMLNVALFYIGYISNVYCRPQSRQFGCKINKHVCMERLGEVQSRKSCFL